MSDLLRRSPTSPPPASGPPAAGPPAADRPRAPRRRRPSPVLAGALAFFFTPAAAFVVGVRAEPFENRPLASFPSLSSGWAFLPGFERWGVDHLPLRDVAVRADSATSELIFGEAPDYANRVAHSAPVGAEPDGGSGAAGAGSGSAPAAVGAGAGSAPAAVGAGAGSAPTAVGAGSGGAPAVAGAARPGGARRTAPPASAAASGGGAPAQPKDSRRRTGIAYPSVVQGDDDWLYAGEDFELACEPELELDEVFAGYRRLISILESSGRRVVLTVAPDKSTILPEHLPDTYLGEKCGTKKKQELWERLRGGELGPQYLDMRGPLEARQAQDREPIYLRRDSHWTSLGKILFAREVVNRLQPGLYQDSDAVNAGPWRTGGDLARRVGDRGKEDTRTWKVRRPGVSTDLEAMDESRDRLVRYSSTNTAGTPMFTAPTVLLGDSFAIRSTGAFLPYFANFTFAHRELWPPERIPVIKGAQVVVLQVVERVFIGDGTSSRGSSLIDPPFLDRLERDLPPVVGSPAK